MKRDAELDYRRIIFAWDQFKDEAEKAAAHLTAVPGSLATWCLSQSLGSFTQRLCPEEL